MKTARLTARIFLYAILLGAIVATWIAVTTLQTPTPEIPGDELEAFQARLVEVAENLVSDRTDSLAQIESMETPGETASAPVFGRIAGRTDFQATKERTCALIRGEIGMTSQPALAAGEYDLPELGNALDEADGLYQDRIDDQTEAMVAVYRDGMMDQTDAHISWLGYQALSNAIRRDLIKYRVLESLPLHEIKLDLYEAQYQRLGDELDAARSATEASADEAAAEISARYDDIIADLIQNIALRLAATPSEPDGPVMGKDILDSLEARVLSLSAVYFPSGLGLEPSVMPRLENEAWLTNERDRSERFVDAARSMME